MAHNILVRLSLFGALAAESALAADPPQPEARPEQLLAESQQVRVRLKVA